MFRLTEVVKNLLIINVIFYFGSRVLLGEEGAKNVLSLVNPHIVNQNYAFEPYQIVTHMFMHADFMHIFFNMIMLAMFGSEMERVWGPKKFLAFFFVAGLSAAGLSLAVQEFTGEYVKMLGASGAVMGVMVAYGMTFPDRMLMLIIPPIPIKAKYMIAIMVGMDLFFGLSGAQTGVAHFAHLGGAAAGIIMIQFWKSRERRR